jgi:hypothetical protein
MTFTIKITGLRTHTVNGVENVVKQIEWTMIGTESGQTFELPQTTEVPDPQADGFIPLSDLTETEVITWIETHEPRIPAIQAHIQYVLDREVEKASLDQSQLPWAPIPDPVVEPPVEPPVDQI